MQYMQAENPNHKNSLLNLRILGNNASSNTRFKEYLQKNN